MRHSFFKEISSSMKLFSTHIVSPATAMTPTLGRYLKSSFADVMNATNGNLEDQIASAVLSLPWYKVEFSRNMYSS
jgi:hypothetical protein